MGIWGLQTFINEFFTQWKREIVKGNMVVDGNQLCNQLYHSQFEGGVCLDWVYGGQYPEYRARVRKFLQYLQQAGITPTAVFDGILHKNDKFKVVYDRYQRRADCRHKVLSRMPHSPPDDSSDKSLPPLAYNVFHATLQELGVKQVIVEGDGDAMIAYKANELDCPVLSKDSDFFMTHLPRGYIPLDRFLREYLREPTATTITAEVFHVSEFNRQFKLQPDNDLHLVIPAIMGNDYLQRLPKVVTVSRDENRFMRLLKDLNQFESLEYFLASIPQQYARALRNNYQQAVEMYNNEQKRKSNVLVAKHGIPQWLAEKYYSGKFMRYLLLARLLGFHLAASSEASKPLRQYAYSILGVGMSETEFVKEYPAANGTVKEVRVEAVHCIQASPSLRLPKLSEVEALRPEDRKQLLYQMFGCDPIQIETLKEKWKLFVASAVFWAKATQPIKAHVQALLVCFLVCSEASTEQHDLPPHGAESWLETQSAFIEWQFTYRDSAGLNQLLMEPLQSPSADCLFDGKLAMSLAAEPNIDQRVTEFGINRDLYQSLLDTVLSQYEVPAEIWKTVKRDPKPLTTSRKIKHDTKLPLGRQEFHRRTDNPKETVTPQKRMMLVPFTHDQRSERRAEPNSRETHPYKIVSQPDFDRQKSQPTEKPNDTAVPQWKKVTLVPYTNSLGAEATNGEKLSHKETQLSDRQSHGRRLEDRQWGSMTQRRTPVPQSHRAGLPPTHSHRAGLPPEHSHRAGRKPQGWTPTRT